MVGNACGAKPGSLGSNATLLSLSVVWSHHGNLSPPQPAPAAEQERGWPVKRLSTDLQSGAHPGAPERA